MKTHHFFITVLLTDRGDIYVDYLSKNREGKIIFWRLNADKFYGKSKTIDRDIRIEARKVFLEIEKSGLMMTDLPMVRFMIRKRKGKTVKIEEEYFFTAVKKDQNQIINDNLVLMSFEEFMADENIDDSEKKVVGKFFSGEFTEILS